MSMIILCSFHFKLFIFFLIFRTEKLGEQLQAFEAEAAVLRTWLLTAKMKLTDIKHLSDQDQQSIATIRSKNDKLLVSLDIFETKQK